MKVGIRFAFVLLALCLAPAALAGAATITEFEVEPGAATSAHLPRYIHPGPDGNLWFSDAGTKPGFGRISPVGERLPWIDDSSGPEDFVFTAGGTMYFTADTGMGRREPNGNPIYDFAFEATFGIVLTPTGGLRWGRKESDVCRFKGEVFGASGVECTGISKTGVVNGLAYAANGTLWGVAYKANQILLVVGDRPELERTIELPVGSGPARLVAGPDGNLWVTMFDASAIDRFLPDGTRKRFPLASGRLPNDIVVGPDGALWFTEYGGNRIGRMTTDGTLTNEYEIPTPNSHPTGITVGPDGALWFTEANAAKIGRLVPDQVAGGPSPLGAPRFIGSPSFSPKRFAVVGKVRARAGRRPAPQGSVLKLSLSEAATVTAAIARKAPGRKAGSRCVAAGKAKPGAKKCTRFVSVGTFKAKARAGANRIPFSGKVSGKRLTSAGYRATLTARDATGKASHAKTASFTIVSG